MYKKAEIGIGTLIIFIAMILVAAIAAGVLIQTAGSLQSKALLTGERTKSQVSTSIVTTQIYAENGSDTFHRLNNFYQIIKLAPGSDPLKLNDTLVSMNLKDNSADLNYGGTVCTPTMRSAHVTGGNGGGPNTTSGGFYTNATSGLGLYTINYLISGQGHIDGYLVRGDILKVCLRSARYVAEDETVTFSVIPKVGSPSIVETATPQIINDEKMYVFP